MSNMKTIELLGEVDRQHRLSALVPNEIPPGPVRLALVVPSTEIKSKDEDEAGAAWLSGIGREWAEDLADTKQDIYTVDDGEAVDQTG